MGVFKNPTLRSEEKSKFIFISNFTLIFRGSKQPFSVNLVILVTITPSSLLLASILPRSTTSDCPGIIYTQANQPSTRF
jgi:hypothetical protein